MDRKSYKKWVAVILLIGIMMNIPSLFAGFIADDYPIGGFVASHLYHLPGDTGRWWDLFRIVDFVGKDVTLHSIRTGELAWWTSPEIRIAFFRPLSVLTHYLDYILWPNRPEMMHGHNIFYYIGILLGLGVYYRSVMGACWVALLALLLFCIDEAHVASVGWIAGRNTVVTAFFSVWTLVSYDRWRREKWRPGVLLTPVLFISALLSSEGAIGLWAHFLAYALFLDRVKPRPENDEVVIGESGDSYRPAIVLRETVKGTIRKIGEGAYRLVHLWPFMLITLGWRILYNALGYGAYGTGFYTDPVRTPLRFLELLPGRLLSALGELFAIPSHLIIYAGSYGGSIFFWSSVVVLAALIWGLVPLIFNSREIKYWATAALLGCIPLATTFPVSRVMLFNGIAVFPLVAHFIAFLIRAFSNSKISATAKKGPKIIMRITKPVTYALAVFFFSLHLLVSPVYAFIFGKQLKLTQGLVQAHASFFPSGPDTGGKTMVVLNTPDLLLASMSGVYHGLDGKTHPARLLWIGATNEMVFLSRPKYDTLRLRVQGGYLRESTNTLHRDPATPFKVGHRVNHARITITVEEITDDGRPKQIALKFPYISHPDLLFAVWKEQGYELIELPRIGQSTVIPAIDISRYIRLHYDALERQPSNRRDQN